VTTRSTEMVHTFTKACLTSVEIRICDPDRHQNLISCSLAHCQPTLKISCKSVQNRRTTRQTNKPWRLHISVVEVIM